MDEKLEIKKGTSALVVIDMQKGIALRPVAPHSSAEVLGNAVKLADAFRARGMPVFLVHVAASDAVRLKPVADEQMAPPVQQLPKDWADFIPELGPKESDIIITKRQWGAFYGTELDLQLRRRKIETIVLCGIATNYGVESTARDAYELGYAQVFAEDATSSVSPDAHLASINFVLKRIGRVRSTEEILKSLK